MIYSGAVFIGCLQELQLLVNPDVTKLFAITACGIASVAAWRDLQVNGYSPHLGAGVHLDSFAGNQVVTNSWRLPVRRAKIHEMFTSP
jgi:hypothetical protein